MFDKDLITGRGGPSLSAQPRADALEPVWRIDELVEDRPVQQCEIEAAESPENVAAALEASFVGTMWAGSVFGACLVFIPLFFSFVSFGFGFEEILFAVVIMGIAGMVGFFAAIISGVMSVGWVLALNVMFSGLLTRRLAVVLSGAIAGFLPTGAFAFLFMADSPTGVDPLQVDFSEVDLYLVGFLTLLTFSAMLFGQIGALRSANSSGVWKNLKLEIDFQESQRLKSNHAGENSSKTSGIQTPFQFRIRHMMIGMIICSCILALDQIFPNHSLLMITCLYTVLQSILLYIDRIYFGLYRKKLLGV